MPGTTTNLALRYPVASDAPDGAGAFYNLAQDVEDRFGRTAAAVSGLAAGTRYGQRAIVGTAEYRWNGSAWRPWESDWATYVVATTGVGVNNYTTGFLWRYVSGEVEVRMNGTIGGSPTGRITMSLPVAASYQSTDDVVSQVTFARQGDNLYYGKILHANGSIVYIDTMQVVTKNGFQILTELGASSTAPTSLVSGDLIVGRFRYTPA